MADSYQLHGTLLDNESLLLVNSTLWRFSITTKYNVLVAS